MSKVYICQLLCPHRHCIIASAWEEGTSNEAEAIAFLDEQRARLKLDPWCALCHSRELKYETKPTRFNSMEEAAPFLIEEELKNLLTRAHVLKQRGGAN